MNTSSNEIFSSWLEKRYKKKNIKGIQPDKLRKYLTTHSGDKYNERNQCDYTSEHARNLRIRVFEPFKNTLEYALMRHTFKMQPM